jgi:hypothetical protein
MSYSLRAELAALLKRATEQRRRIKVLQSSLDQLTDRIGAELAPYGVEQFLA